MDPGIFFIGGGEGSPNFGSEKTVELVCGKLPRGGGGEGGTPLQETKRDVPLDGVALSRLE